MTEQRPASLPADVLHMFAPVSAGGGSAVAVAHASGAGAAVARPAPLFTDTTNRNAGDTSADEDEEEEGTSSSDTDGDARTAARDGEPRAPAGIGPRLTHLTLATEGTVPHALTYVHARVACTHLRVLDTGRFRGSVPAPFLLAVAHSCPHLERAVLDGPDTATDDVVRDLLAHCPRLRLLSLEGNTRLTRPGLLEALTSRAPPRQLERVNVRGTLLTLRADDVLRLALRCPRLATVVVGRYQLQRFVGDDAPAAATPLAAFARIPPASDYTARRTRPPPRAPATPVLDALARPGTPKGGVPVQLFHDERDDTLDLVAFRTVWRFFLSTAVLPDLLGPAA